MDADGNALPGFVMSPRQRQADAVASDETDNRCSTQGGGGTGDTNPRVDIVEVPDDVVEDLTSGGQRPYIPGRSVVIHQSESFGGNAAVQSVVVDEFVDDAPLVDCIDILPGACVGDAVAGSGGAGDRQPPASPSVLRLKPTMDSDLRSSSMLSLKSLSPGAVKRSLDGVGRNIKGLVARDRWVDETLHVDAPASHEDFNVDAERLFNYENDNVCYEWADNVGRWGWRKSLAYSMLTSLWIMFVSVAVAVFFTGYMFLQYYTRLQCFFYPRAHWPLGTQWVDTFFTALETFFLHMGHYALLACMYGRRRVHTIFWMNLLIATAACVYEVSSQPIGTRGTWVTYIPKVIVMLLTFVANGYKMSRALVPPSEPRKERMRCGVVLCAPITLAVVTGIVFGKLAMPFYADPHTTEKEKLAITIVAPAFFAVSQALCRMSAERCRFNHAGTSYVLLLIQQGLSAALLRILQAGLQNMSDVVIIGFYFGGLGIADRSTIMLRDGIAYIVFRCGKRLPGDFFAIPRRRRLIGDILIVDLFLEYAAIMIGNSVVLGVRLAYMSDGVDSVGSFFERTAVQLAIQSVATAISIYLSGARQNLPVMRLWRRFWKAYAAVISLVIIMGAFYFLQPLTQTIRENIAKGNADLPCIY
eukprot:Opistho-2@57361